MARFAIIFLALFAITAYSFKFGVLNDIHYDPYFDPSESVSDMCRKNSPIHIPENMVNAWSSPFGHFGCDSPPELVDLVLEKIQDLEPDLDVLLVSGDFLAHGFAVKDGTPDHYDLLKETFEKVLMTLSDHLPNTIILPAIGNNDIKFHYTAPRQDDEAPDYYEFLSDIMFDKMPGNKFLNKKSINKTLLKYGYYRVDISTKLSVLSVNSLYQNTVNPSKEEDIKLGQFEWIEDQLKGSESNRKFIFFFHIYPGIYEAYNQNIFWEEDLTERFVDMMEKYSDNVALVLGAHTHFGDIRIHQKVLDPTSPSQDINGYLSDYISPKSHKNEIQRSDAKFPMLITPSITPIFLNNPGATLFEVNKSTITNVRFVFMELYKFPKTKEEANFKIVSFKDEFGLDEFNAATVQDFIQRSENSYNLFYMKALPYKIGYFGLLRSISWYIYSQLGAISIWSNKKYHCMSRHITTSDFNKCLGK